MAGVKKVKLQTIYRPAETGKESQIRGNTPIIMINAELSCVIMSSDGKVIQKSITMVRVSE